jgi:O-antigen ligase
VISTAQIPRLSAPRITDANADKRSRVAQCGLLLLLLVGPLCFGAAEPWSLLVLETGTAGVFLLWIALTWSRVRLRVDPATGVLLLFGCLAFFQIGTNITTNRYATNQELLKLTAYFLCFFLARQMMVSPQSRKLTATTLIIFGAALATFAIVQRLQGNERIYWLRATSSSTFFGPYPNKDHYAGLLEMLVPFALVGAASSIAPASRRVLCAFAASVMIASVFLSGSRSGTAVVIFEIAIFIAVILPAMHLRWRGVAFSILSGSFSLALIVWIAGQPLTQQATTLRGGGTDASVLSRRQLTVDAFQLVKRRPILGWGLGTFPSIYPQVQSWYGDQFVNAAHDDYLQVLVETGIVGLGLMLLFIATVFHAGIKRFVRAPTSVVSAALFGCCGFLLHSFTDFNLHIPANAAVFFTLCGLICASESGGEEKQSLRGGSFTLDRSRTRSGSR